MTAKGAAEELLRRINSAVKEMDGARDGYISRSKIVGNLLLEAKTLHPKVKDFDAFLKRVDGLHLSRAYELLKIAGGRTTEADLKKENRERQQRHRIKQKTKPMQPEPKPDPGPRPKPMPESFRDVTEISSPTTAGADSGRALREFLLACEKWLPLMTSNELNMARSHVASWGMQRKAS
jgi:hypothetical protein